jgi:hypothetical protein
MRIEEINAEESLRLKDSRYIESFKSEIGINGGSQILKESLNNAADVIDSSRVDTM